MAKFANLTFTSQGTQMLVQAQNTHTLTFTCGKLGSGSITDSDDITKFTDLKSPKMKLPIVSVDDSNPEKLVLTFDTSNTNLEEGFVSREILLNWIMVQKLYMHTVMLEITMIIFRRKILRLMKTGW